MKSCVAWAVSQLVCGSSRSRVIIGMGTTHAWESFGDNEPPDIQTVAKGLGGGYVVIGFLGFVLTMVLGILVLVQSLCLNRSQTLLRAMVVAGNTDTRLWYVADHLGAIIHLMCCDQAHPMSCAGAVAVQKVIAAENLLENGRQTGEYLAQLLRERLLCPNSPTEAITFDIRGGGSFWAVEFDFAGATKEFAMRVQARCLENGLIVMGMPPGANVTNTEGGHIILAPAYNMTEKEAAEVVSVFVSSVRATCGD
jgi:E3 ubiquitin-protein ligase TRIP12